jgi:ribonuclease J
MTLSRRVVQETLDSCLRRGMYDFTEIKTKMRDDLAKFIFKKTKRKPMILPIIMDM